MSFTGNLFKLKVKIARILGVDNLKQKIVCLIIILISILISSCSRPVQSQDGTSVNESSGPTGISNSKSSVYPAFVKNGDKTLWGFIDSKGSFVIQPVYETVMNIQENGITQVIRGGKAGLLDNQGNEILNTEYNFIYDFSEGIAVAEKADGGYCIINEEGKTLFESQDFIGEFHDGIAPVAHKIDDTTVLYGYIDKTGKTIIEPKYESASSFDGGRAVVKVGENEYALIDKTGSTVINLQYKNVFDLSEGILTYYDSNDMKGYLKTDGQKITNADFTYTEAFKDGFAIVGVSSGDNNTKYGVIGKDGRYIISPIYSSVRYIGGEMFAVSTDALYPFQDTLVKKAILNKEGQKITDFKYYDIGEYRDGMLSVSEEKSTYIINNKGEKVENQPVVDGCGTMVHMGDMIRADIDNELTYFSKNGEVIWKSASSQTLKNGAVVKSIKYRPDRGMLIYYPEVTGLQDKNIENIINSRLKAEFAGGDPVSPKEEGVYSESLDIGYSIFEIRDLLIVEKSGYLFPIGAAHGMPMEEYYHIDLKTGKLFTLDDLFKKDSGYLSILSGIINKQIDEKRKGSDSMFMDDVTVDIQSSQGFVIGGNSLKIFFQPYEIAPYAAGFPEFEIPYSDLKDIIDTNGGFWNSFNTAQ